MGLNIVNIEKLLLGGVSRGREADRRHFLKQIRISVIHSIIAASSFSTMAAASAKSGTPCTHGASPLTTPRAREQAAFLDTLVKNPSGEIQFLDRFDGKMHLVDAAFVSSTWARAASDLLATHSTELAMKLIPCAEMMQYHVDGTPPMTGDVAKNDFAALRSVRGVTALVAKRIPCNCLGALKKQIPKTEDCRFCKVPKLSKQLSRCSVCKIVSYCSKECQVKDWKQHKIDCKSNANKAEFFTSLPTGGDGVNNRG